MAHPAHDANEVPSVLQPYDDRIYPGVMNRTWAHSQFFTSLIGLAIRDLNSIRGLPGLAYRTLLAETVECPSCRCMFSEEGFEAHRVDGRCGNCDNAQPGMSLQFSTISHD